MGRCIDVLWPEDGTRWKAKVINLNPVTGMATLYYERKEKQDGGDAPKEEGEKKSDAADPDPNAERPPSEPEDVKMTDATEEPAKAEDKKDGEGAGDD